MNFREWYRIDEMKQQYRDYLNKKFPHLPEQIRKEIGQNHIVPYLKGQKGHSFSTIDDFIANDVCVRKFEDAEWPSDPELIYVNYKSFLPDVQSKMMIFNFGHRKIGGLKRHDQRMIDQERLMGEKGADGMEPIIVVKHPNGYDLIEGWHRTFQFLLSGAPDDEREAIVNGEAMANTLSPGNWKPVKIKAYVGKPISRITWTTGAPSQPREYDAPTLAMYDIQSDEDDPSDKA